MSALPFATKVTPQSRWDRLVLDATEKEQLNTICSRIKDYKRGYRIKEIKLHRQDLGLKVLFSGPSNPVKAMAAKAIADESGLELYRVDLSKVVSKYASENEKNLQKIFEHAEEANYLLFFDEADALFGKHTEVKDAHDRYANIEVNYLLQRIEERKAVAILAVNMTRNVDETLAKRMNYIIKFPPSLHRHKQNS